ncbi:19296_t:CDS:2 [Gigaspora margarita]|uniref:19296_t:CDS:1 n=1 Tax=Gigaspora margarita TaxID=4874 RepID=A0ABN7VX19_GIGMA|nr:19296_t:CDS:2 [Gigaspora margarita]
MDDLSTYTSSEKFSSESSDTYEHESDCMVISSPELIYQNEECDSSLEVALSSEKVIPANIKACNYINKISLVDFDYEDLILSEQQETSEPDKIARQSSDTAASAHTKKPGKGGRSSLRSDAWKWFSEETIKET